MSDCIVSMKGASAALTTPFTREGSVDWDRLVDHSKALLEAGMMTVGAFGTTGEGASVPRSVRMATADEFTRRGLGLERVVACVFALSVEEAAEDLSAAARAGYGAVLLPPPFYYKDLSQDDLFGWFAAAFERAGPDCRDVILYNIPQLTGAVVDAELVSRLRASFGDVIVGVKDSAGDWDATAATIAAHGDLSVLVGHEGHLARAVKLGAAGAISGMANIAPALVAKLAAGEHDPRIDRALELVLDLPVVPAIKALQAAAMDDGAWNAVLPPLQALDETTAASLIRDVLPLLR